MANGLVNVADFSRGLINDDFKTIWIGIKGLESTAADMRVIPNIQKMEAKLTTETKEQRVFGDAGKRTIKTNVTPSVGTEIAWAKDNEVLNYLYGASLATDEGGITQVAVQELNGDILNYIGIVVGDNFGINGAPDDDMIASVSFDYAGGNTQHIKEAEWLTMLGEAGETE